jgi:hypothetical protein
LVISISFVVVGGLLASLSSGSGFRSSRSVRGVLAALWFRLCVWASLLCCTYSLTR